MEKLGFEYILRVCKSYLCGFSEDEFRVFHQTLQWHTHIDDLCPLVFSAVVRHKLAVPGVEDDET